MNILHVTEALGGGLWNVLKLIVTQQVKSNHNVTLIHSMRADTPSAELIDKSLPSGVRRVVVPMVSSISVCNDLKALNDLLKIFREDFDVIHLHSSKAGVLGRIASFLQRNGTPCFYTPHGFSFLRRDISSHKRTAFRVFESIPARLAGITLACSESEMQHAQSLFSRNKVVLIENAINVSAIKPAQPDANRFCRVATSGRLCPQKNPAAFSRLAADCEHIPDVEFLWIGGGELEAELLIDGQRPRNLVVTGWVSSEEVANHLEETDIFVMTSLWEGMPLSLLEAQTAGLPAVVPDVEGCRDVVIDGVTGYICESPDEMTARIQQLIDEPTLRRRLGDEARKRALIRFAPERMHKEIMQAYQAEIKRKSK